MELEQRFTCPCLADLADNVVVVISQVKTSTIIAGYCDPT